MPKEVKEILDAEELRVPWCISYPSLRHAQISRLRWPGHSEDVRKTVSILTLTLASLGYPLLT